MPIIYAGTKNRNSLLILLNNSIVSVQHGNLHTYTHTHKNSREQAEKQIKPSCGRIRKLWRKSSSESIQGGANSEHLSPFKIFLAVYLNAFLRYKHGIEDRLA